MQNISSKTPKRINFEHLKIRKSTTGYVVANEITGNHLTFCWNKRIRRFDLHIKDSSGNRIESHKMRPNELKQNLQQIQQKFAPDLFKLLKILPTWWLCKNKYYLSNFPNHDLTASLLKSQLIKGVATMSASDIECISNSTQEIRFHPNWIYVFPEAVIATSNKKRKPKLIIFPIDIRGERIVIGVSYERFFQLLKTFGATLELIFPNQIIEHLQLERI